VPWIQSIKPLSSIIGYYFSSGLSKNHLNVVHIQNRHYKGTVLKLKLPNVLISAENEKGREENKSQTKILARSRLKNDCQNMQTS
jgi:hypothetical protein